MKRRGKAQSRLYSLELFTLIMCNVDSICARWRRGMSMKPSA